VFAVGSPSPHATEVRLLLPHAPPKRASGPAANAMTEESSTEEEGSIIYEPRIAAMVAEIISPAESALGCEVLFGCAEEVAVHCTTSMP